MYRICYLLLLVTGSILGQHNGPQIISLQIDNDVFGFKKSDNYYTSGLFVSYSYSPKLIPIIKSIGYNLVQIKVGQQIYTPSGQYLKNEDNYDIPFAGWLFGSINSLTITNQDAFGFGLEIGTTGKASGANKFQQRIHKALNLYKVPEWKTQIPNEIMVNISAKYNRKLINSIFSESIAVLGTKNINIQQGVYFLMFENFESFNTFSTIDKNISGFVGFKYRYTFFDALIEGSLWNNNAPIVRDPKTHSFIAEAGIKINVKKLNFGFSYLYNTKQTKSQEHHYYGQLSIAYAF